MHSISTFIRGLAISFFAVVLLNACGGGGGGGGGGGNPGGVPGSSGGGVPGSSGSPAATAPSVATLVTILVYPSPPSNLPKGLTQKFTAMGAFSDYTWKDVTASVAWSSTATTVATINASGLATGVGVGTTNVTASSGGISSTFVALTVTPAILQSIALTPTNPVIGAGQSTQFAATGSYSDGTTQDITSSVTWSSGNTAAVTMNATGSAFGTAPGTATITANSGGVSANTVLTVAGYSVGGTQSLLPAGTSVTLLNGTDNLTLTNLTASSTNKVPFNFNIPLSLGAAYNVIVSAQPTGGVHPCTVVDGIGTITTTYITSVQVVCGPAVGTYAGVVNLRGGATNGPAATALFNFPVGIAVDAAGNMYVADSGNSSIRQITPAGMVSTLAGTGTVGFVNGTGTAASFWQPYGVAVDSKGNVYVADAGNNAIRKIAPGGVVTTFAGSNIGGFANGTGSAATFTYPTGIAIDKADNIYVADTSNNAIRMITPAGVVTTLAGTGTVGAANGAALTTATFSAPNGVAVDTAGNVYVADTGNHVIRKIAAGQVTTFAGTVGVFGGFANGTGTAAMFNTPMNVAVDAAGNVYVSDRSNQLIRAITPAGVVTTLAGAANPTMGFSDGPALSAMFGSPYGVATDSTGHVYVSDNWNNIIRKFTP